jgi:hypothetical protein
VPIPWGEQAPSFEDSSYVLRKGPLHISSTAQQLKWKTFQIHADFQSTGGGDLYLDTKLCILCNIHISYSAVECKMFCAEALHKLEKIVKIVSYRVLSEDVTALQVPFLTQELCW